MRDNNVLTIICIIMMYYKNLKFNTNFVYRNLFARVALMYLKSKISTNSQQLGQRSARIRLSAGEG